MISSVRQSAGLPLNSQRTTNFSESMNEKSQRRYLQEHLPDIPHVLVTTLSGLLEGQLTDMARARVGQGGGRYRLNPHHPDYKKLCVNRDRFDRLTPAERERFKFSGVVPRSNVTVTDAPTTATIPLATLASDNSIEKNNVVNVLLQLGMTQTVALQMYVDARQLAEIDGCIT